MKKIVTAAASAVLVIAVAIGVASAQTEPRFTLSGVVVVDGGGRAWLQEPQLTQNQPVALRPGESIGPYRLTKISEDRVELVGPAGPISVLLAGISGPAVPASVVVRPSPPQAPQLAPTTGPDRVVILPPGPPLAPLPPGTPRVDFGSLLRGVPPPQ